MLAGEREGFLLSPTLGPLLMLVGCVGALWLVGRPRNRRLGLALLAGLMTLQLLFSGLVYNPTSNPAALFPETLGTQTLRSHIGTGRVLLAGPRTKENSLMPLRLRAVGGYGSMYPSRLADLLRAAGCPPGRQLVASPDLPPRWRDALSVRAVLTAPDTLTRVKEVKLLYEGNDCILYRNPTALPRARVHPPEAISLWANRSAAAQRIAAPGFRPDLEVALEANTPLHHPTGAEPDPPPSRPARIVIDEPERIVVDILPGDPRAGAVLVLADAYGDGWTARAGSQELEVEPANVGLRAVRLPAGFGGQVEFTYAAPGEGTGIALSLLALLACAVVLLRKPTSA